MASERGGRRLLVFLIAIGGAFLFVNLLWLSGSNLPSKIDDIHIPGLQKTPAEKEATNTTASDSLDTEPPILNNDDEDSSQDASDNNDFDGAIVDNHPIASLMQAADEAWNAYENDRSTTFRDTVAKYRRKYGRHPPPGFKEWYIYARDRNVHNVDDFEQIMDDLRPFWGIEPAEIRALAAHMSKDQDGVSGIHIRNHKIWTLTNADWRAETLQTLIEKFVEKLPDMDIAMNKLDQPRVLVPWDDMQAHLQKEVSTRQLVPDAESGWTQGMSGYFTYNPNVTETDVPDFGWFPAHGKQYMDIAKVACPPESHARDNSSTQASAEALYKDPLGGFITNYNRSTDLCTIGPEIEWNHGFLFTPSTIIASNKLLPIFGECKVNVNSDILFPANMYWKHDERYDYNSTFDVDWEDKKDIAVWRGVTSGGAQLATNWRNMHRQRLVMFLNSTEMASQEVRIITENPDNHTNYENFHQFQPSKFAEEHTDVGFVEAWGCIPDCSFYDDVWTFKPQGALGEQFRSKYVVDVDGHSFSGRWRAFLQSKSLGIKGTIFREWHDSRLFAWRHFVPMDNRFDDIYSILTYFIGVGTPGFHGAGQVEAGMGEDYANEDVYVPRHDFEAKKLALQAREWADKVLRSEDIEIYMYRLLLEYARIIDDNRDHIGYSGDGSELDVYDNQHPIASSHS